MKLLKKLFYTIAMIIMAGCMFILVCALNPGLTQKLALAVGQDGMAVSAEKKEPGAAGANEMSGGLAESQSQDKNGYDLGKVDSTVTDSTEPVVQVGYIAPSEDAVVQPKQVYGKTGYEPVWGEEEQIPDEEAESLKAVLSTGEVGENLAFDTAIYPYYGMLDGELQQLYRQIYANAMELKTSFAPVITVGIQRVKNVFEAVYNDHPELFWLETEYSCKYNGKGICLEITLKYNDTIRDFEASRRAFQEEAQAIVQEASKKESPAEKELFVHDALVKRVEYSASADKNQSAYSALVEGKSVCAGYARAFQYLMQQLGIPCYYCTGYSGEDHAWNIIRLDDQYWNVDVTWDDTEPSTYDYYNKTDLEYAKTHVRKGLSVYLPACSGSLSETLAQELEDSDLENYINPNPIEPLSYPSGLLMTEEDRKEQENLSKAGITEQEVLDDMSAYYADCLEQLVEAGTGKQFFDNVVPESLWTSVEQAYSSGSYEKGYVTEALKQLKMENFAIQLQVDNLGGGYYRIYHSIVTW